MTLGNKYGGFMRGRARKRGLKAPLSCENRQKKKSIK